MSLGNLVSGFLLRQMEYDADRYEARMVGGKVFASTCWRLRELSLAQNGAYADLQSSWQERRLPDNLPRLILANVSQIPAEVMAAYRKAMGQAKTGLFDTHPSDRDRIAHARAEGDDGIFDLEGPATDLFRNFDALARVATFDRYRTLLGPEIRKEQLFTVAELVRGRRPWQEGEVACRRFFLDSPNYEAAPAAVGRPKAPTDAPPRSAPWFAARQTMESAHDDFLKATKAWEEASTACVNAGAGMLLAKTECKFKPKDFGLTSPKLKDAERTRDAHTLGQVEQAACRHAPVLRGRDALVRADAGHPPPRWIPSPRVVPDGTARGEEGDSRFTHASRAPGGERHAGDGPGDPCARRWPSPLLEVFPTRGTTRRTPRSSAQISPRWRRCGTCLRVSLEGRRHDLLPLRARPGRHPLYALRLAH